MDKGVARRAVLDPCAGPEDGWEESSGNSRKGSKQTQMVKVDPADWAADGSIVYQSIC